VAALIAQLGAAAQSVAASAAAIDRASETLRSGAREGKGLADDVAERAADGRSSMAAALGGMARIREAVDTAVQRFDRLVAELTRVGRVTQVIDDIAGRTNLLALNAAIIAAQAGEHGKAFSVVADQVSALADRSHRSAREIADLIHAVQDDTGAAVAAVSERSAKVERGVERSRVADQVLQKILDKTATQATRARQIASATQRQGSDLGRVQGAMRTVHEIVDQIDGAARGQQTATLEIGQTMANLRTLGAAVRHSTEEQRRGTKLIAEAASRVAEMAGQIADAIRAQASSRETIQHALRVFDGVAQETTRGVEAINSGVATLSARAKQLEDGIGRFKTR
jgi:methyl-accepting chemotaxis protein